jgi:prolipoprotein diacylglyceryltransferase
VEIVRAKDDRFFGPFTVAQVISVVLVLLGLVLLARVQFLSRASKTLSRAQTRDLR